MSKDQSRLVNNNDRNKQQVENDLPEIATVQEAAKYLRVNIRTVYNAIRNGSIPSQRVGRVIRLRREAILNWLDRG